MLIFDSILGARVLAPSLVGLGGLAGAVWGCDVVERTPSGRNGVSDTAVETSVACDPDNGGITLPAGFCASVFADVVGGARHIAVAPNGDVFVALQSAPAPTEAGAAPTGGILALRDTNQDGRADRRAYFGALGGTGVALWNGYVYADAKTSIVRFPLPAGNLTPSGPAETVVDGIPTGGHSARNFAIDRRGSLFVNIGSLSNACQERDRQRESRGHDPCTELETRAGIWRFDAGRTGQRFTPATRYATGIRNAVALAVNPADDLPYVAQHGRDQLFQNWPQLYDAERGAELPAEEFMRVEPGDDFGWPYCYYDQLQKRRVLAPEYGGDGKAVGLCARKKAPLVGFPGHWGPNGLHFYTGKMFPERYRGGAFIAFHGSWNRAPLPQAGFKVVFVPFSDGRPSGSYETFADGFRDGGGQARHRPVGLAQAPDGALYITDDRGGRIWRVVYRGTR